MKNVGTRLIVASCALSGALAAVTAAQAALPPYYQRAREIEAIVNNAEVARALSGRAPIDSVTRVGEDRYEIEAGACRLEVRIETDASGETAPGPRRMKLEVGPPECK